MKTLNKPVARQSGITLIEVSIALIIAAIVAAAAFILFQQNQRRNDAQDGAAFMTTLLTETATKIGRNGGYTGLNATALFNSGVIAKELGVISSANLVTAKSVNFYTKLAAGVDSGTGNAQISVRAKGREACVAMALAAVNNASSVKVQSVSVSDLGTDPTLTAGTTVTTPATAASACGDVQSDVIALLNP